jgi:hypothetical protein
MTEAVPRPAGIGPRRRRPRPIVVAATSLAAFLATLTLLAAQMRAGRDPALAGSRPTVVTSALGSGHVVTRTSGGAASVSTTGGAGHHATHPVVTRSSGGGEGEDD